MTAAISRHDLYACLREWAVGRESARTSEWLCAELHVEDRTLRRWAKELVREDGYPVCTAVHPPHGFYLPVTPSEAGETVACWRKRGKEMQDDASALEAAVARVFRLQGLFDEGVA
jgi:hypothetical protein